VSWDVSTLPFNISRNSHAVPLEGADLPFSDFKYSVYGAPEPISWFRRHCHRRPILALLEFPMQGLYRARFLNMATGRPRYSTYREFNLTYICFDALFEIISLIEQLLI